MMITKKLIKNFKIKLRIVTQILKNKKKIMIVTLKNKKKRTKWPSFKICKYFKIRIFKKAIADFWLEQVPNKYYLYYNYI